MNADDFVFKWMSTHLESFPESNVTSTIRKLKSLGVDSNVINSCLQKTIPGQDATPQQILGALKVLPEIESFTDHAILAIGHSLKTGPGNISTKAFADLFN